MSIFEKFKNIFSTTGNGGDGKKKSKFPHINQESDPNEFWEIVGELGDGAFGKVYKAKHKEKNSFAALKQVDITQETDLEEYSVEIDILHECNHKNVVGIFESYLQNEKLWMYIEFCELGALDSIMLELDRPLNEVQIKYVCKEMCEGLDFLHQNLVIHRDLKAGNVLLTQDGGVRIADFGVSAKNSNVKQRRDSFIGTPYWMAPEVILCETIKDNPYDYKADIWSFGITLIEFSQIEPPNHEMHPMRVVLKIQKSEPPTLKSPKKWSLQFNDFLKNCLNKDPEKRLSAPDLLKHNFINDVKGREGIEDLICELNGEVTLEEKEIEEDADSDNIESEGGSTKQGEEVKTLKPEKMDEGVNVGISLNSTISSSSTDPSPKEEDFDKSIIRNRKRINEDNVFSGNQGDTSPESDKDVQSKKKKNYRSLTKTRKFILNGEVKTSQVQKLVAGNEVDDEKQREHKLWKADLRELKVLHRQENRQLQDLEVKCQQSIDEQIKKFEQDDQNLKNQYEYQLEVIAKQHKHAVDKMNNLHFNEKKNLMKKIKFEQERDAKVFSEGLKQDMKLLKQEVEMLPKEKRKEVWGMRKTEKEIEQSNKLKQFQEKQHHEMEKSLSKLDEQQAQQFSLSEKQFLQQKQQILKARETSFWDLEERHMQEKFQLAEQQLKNKFILKRHHMMLRHSKELDQIKRVNAGKEDQQALCHSLELKRLPKILKQDAKTRTMMYRESIRISICNLSYEQEKEKLKKFEDQEKRRAKEEKMRLERKHRRQMEDLKAKNKSLLKELEQVHNDKQKMLLDVEMQKTLELSNAYRSQLNKWKDGLVFKKKQLEDLFSSQLDEQAKFLEVRDYASASNISAAASITPIIKRKFSPKLIAFSGGETVEDAQEEDFLKSNLLRSKPHRSSGVLGNLAEKFRESQRMSVRSGASDKSVLQLLPSNFDINLERKESDKEKRRSGEVKVFEGTKTVNLTPEGENEEKILSLELNQNKEIEKEKINEEKKIKNNNISEIKDKNLVQNDRLDKNSILINNKQENEKNNSEKEIKEQINVNIINETKEPEDVLNDKNTNETKIISASKEEKKYSEKEEVADKFQLLDEGLKRKGEAEIENKVKDEKNKEIEKEKEKTEELKVEENIINFEEKKELKEEKEKQFEENKKIDYQNQNEISNKKVEENFEIEEEDEEEGEDFEYDDEDIDQVIGTIEDIKEEYKEETNKVNLQETLTDISNETGKMEKSEEKNNDVKEVDINKQLSDQVENKLKIEDFCDKEKNLIKETETLKTKTMENPISSNQDFNNLTNNLTHLSISNDNIQNNVVNDKNDNINITQINVSTDSIQSDEKSENEVKCPVANQPLSQIQPSQTTTTERGNSPEEVIITEESTTKNQITPTTEQEDKASLSKNSEIKTTTIVTEHPTSFSSSNPPTDLNTPTDSGIDIQTSSTSSNLLSSFSTTPDSINSNQMDFEFASSLINSKSQTQTIQQSIENQAVTIETQENSKEDKQKLEEKKCLEDKNVNKKQLIDLEEKLETNKKEINEKIEEKNENNKEIKKIEDLIIKDVNIPTQENINQQQQQQNKQQEKQNREEKDDIEEKNQKEKKKDEEKKNELEEKQEQNNKEEKKEKKNSDELQKEEEKDPKNINETNNEKNENIKKIETKNEKSEEEIKELEEINFEDEDKKKYEEKTKENNKELEQNEKNFSEQKIEEKEEKEKQQQQKEEEKKQNKEVEKQQKEEKEENLQQKHQNSEDLNNKILQNIDILQEQKQQNINIPNNKNDNNDDNYGYNNDDNNDNNDVNYDNNHKDSEEKNINNNNDTANSFQSS